MALVFKLPRWNLLESGVELRANGCFKTNPHGVADRIAGYSGAQRLDRKLVATAGPA
jgi:hypothetical protein